MGGNNKNMITKKLSNLIIRKVGEHNFICSIDISILKNDIEIFSKTISIPFYEYCADDVKVWVKNEVSEEIQKIKSDISDEIEMKSKINEVITKL